MPAGPKPELFHVIAHAGSAAVRRRVSELDLERRINFRNVHFESHARALADLGGGGPPALWDGAVLYVGVAAIEPVLVRMAEEKAREPR